MKKEMCILLTAIVLATVCAAAPGAAQKSAPGEQFVGTWAGTWDGAGSGGFVLTLERADDGRLGGRVSVTGEPTYKAVLKTVSFEGSKMTARYDFPPDENGEVILDAAFDATEAKGTWAVRAKATGEEFATGTWAVTRK